MYPENFSTRLQSLLELNNLENRIAKNEFDLNIIDNKIDFGIVNNIMEKERKKSLNWLKNALK